MMLGCPTPAGNVRRLTTWISKFHFHSQACKLFDLNSRLVYLASSRSANTSFINPAKYFPFTRLSVFMKTSLRTSTDYETRILPHNPDLRRLSPIGLYFALNLSKRWNVFRSWKWFFLLIPKVGYFSSPSFVNRLYNYKLQTFWK